MRGECERTVDALLLSPLKKQLIEGYLQKCFICFFINKHIEPFCIHLSRSAYDVSECQSNDMISEGETLNTLRALLADAGPGNVKSGGKFNALAI